MLSRNWQTTERRRLKGFLEADKNVPTYVLLVDFEEYIDLYNPISPDGR